MIISIYQHHHILTEDTTVSLPTSSVGDNHLSDENQNNNDNNNQDEDDDMSSSRDTTNSNDTIINLSLSSSSQQQQQQQLSPRQRTQYTIDDTVCSPTQPHVLQNIVHKRCQSLDVYLQQKPIANHTQDAFNNLLEMITTNTDNTTIMMIFKQQ